MTPDTLQWLYPTNKRKLFTDHKAVLKQLDYNVRQIEDGKGNDLVLTGLRKIGKTLILKEFMHRLIKLNGRCVPVYIDLEGMGLEPKNFAFIYMGQVLHWFNSRGANMPIRIGERDQIYSELATLDDGKIIMRL